MQTPISLVTPDGRIGCVQGMTGIGRPQDWRAVRDEGGPAGWALVEKARDATDLRFPLCILPMTVRDLEATLTLHMVGGTRDQAGGLVLRAQAATHYYVARASVADKSVRLYRVQAGRRVGIAGKEAPVTLGKWHTIGVKVQDDRFEVSFDGAPLFSATDRGLPNPGAVGVWSHADSETHFGMITVKPIP